MPRKRSSRSYFNPRSHKGSDLLTRPERRERTKFQSTLPQGERRSSSVRSTDPQQFQSTLPQGERQRRVECLCGQNDHFNPRSHKGSDILQPEPASCRKNFNPRSHKGSDILVRLPCKAGDNFNPRSHKGSDAVPGYSAK